MTELPAGVVGPHDMDQQHTVRVEPLDVVPAVLAAHSNEDAELQEENMAADAGTAALRSKAHVFEDLSG